MNTVKVRQIFDYDTWTYTYLIWCEETKKCLPYINKKWLKNNPIIN